MHQENCELNDDISNERVNQSIFNDNLDIFEAEIHEKFQQVYTKLKEKKNEFKAKINYLKEEIDIRVESLKIQLDENAELLKQSLDEMLKQEEVDSFHNSIKYSQDIDKDSTSNDLELLGSRCVGSKQNCISKWNQKINDYELKSSLQISENELNDDLILKRDFESIINKCERSVLFKVNIFCLLENVGLCVVINDEIIIYDKNMQKQIKKTSISSILNENIRFYGLKQIIASPNNDIYVYAGSRSYDRKYILKLNKELELITQTEFNKSYLVLKFHYYDSYLYAVRCYDGNSYELLKFNDDLKDEPKHEIIHTHSSTCILSLSFLNNSFFMHHVGCMFIFQIEPFQFIKKFVHNSINTRIFSLNNQFHVLSSNSLLILNDKFEEVQSLERRPDFKDEFGSYLIDIIEFNGKHLFYFYNNMNERTILFI